MIPLYIIIFAFTVLIIIWSAFYWYQTRSRFALLFNQFPYLRPFIPGFGLYPLHTRTPENIFFLSRKFLSSFNETFTVWFGICGTIHIIAAEDAEIVLSNVKYIEKSFSYFMLRPWLGTGLLTSDGTHWHQRRKMLTPSFHYNILQIFVKAFGGHCEILVDKLIELSKEGKTNIVPVLSHMTLAMILETSMGIKFDENDKKVKRYYEDLYKLCEILIIRMYTPWKIPDMLYHLFPSAWKEKKLIKSLHQYTNGVIKTREDQFLDFDDMELESKSNKDTFIKKRLAMLDLLISAKRRQEIDYDGIREEVDTFVFEGHDTTSVGLTYILLLLANHKDIQEKIIKELDDIFSKDDRHATYDDLQNMKYVECCIKEALRLYPSVPLIGRKINDDMPLTLHVAPAGSHVFIHIYNIHRDPRHFPDPEKYDPDRFLPENSTGRHPYAYIPFSAGPRNCIGQKFAMLELKSVVSVILRNFTMEPIDSPKDLTFIADLILRFKGPAYIKFIPRK